MRGLPESRPGVDATADLRPRENHDSDMSAQPLFILLCSGEHEKIQMTAMTASIAAVSERPVRIFVGMNALLVFRRDPAESRYQGGEFSRLMKAGKMPDALDLLRQGKLLGDLKLYACTMGLDTAGLTLQDLEEGLFDGLNGLTSFLADAQSGQLLTF
jgi:peroxiredoxin family protein